MGKKKNKNVDGWGDVGSNLTQAEAEALAASKGKTVQQIADKALSKGLTIGGNFAENLSTTGLSTYQSAVLGSMGLTNNSKNANSSAGRDFANALGINNTVYNLAQSQSTIPKGHVVSGFTTNNNQVAPVVVPRNTISSSNYSGTSSRTSPLGIQFMAEANKPLAQRVAENPNGPWSLQTLEQTGQLKPYTDPASAGDAPAAPEPAAAEPPPPNLNAGLGDTTTSAGATSFRGNRGKDRKKGQKFSLEDLSRSMMVKRNKNTSLQIGNRYGINR